MSTLGTDDSQREWDWRLVPICADEAEPDTELRAFIESFKSEIDQEYHTIVCRSARFLTNPTRDEETALGNLVADTLAHKARVDVAFVGGGSIRRQKLGPVVTLGDLRETLPFDGTLLKLIITGTQFWRSPGDLYIVPGRVGGVSERSPASHQPCRRKAHIQGCVKEEQECGYDPLCSERRKEAGPRIGFRPLYTAPPRRQAESGSTKRVDKVNPPL